jgi:tetratricopeptide (TPR) repeat protein
MTGARRSLCGAADIKGWSTRLVPEQIRAQQALVDVMLAACREARLPEEIVQSSGDGVLIMAPSDIDESDVIPNLIQGLEIALHQENRLLADAAKIRLRFSLTSGMVTPGPAGVNGAAVVECFRLLDSPPVKDALLDYPHAQLAVIVSDYLFQDVIRNGFRNLRAEDFWPARAELPDKGFSAGAWLYVNDRRDGPPDTSPDTPSRSSHSAPAAPSRPRPDLPGEIGAARALMDGGRPTAALRVLEAMTPADSAVRLAFLDVRADGLLELREYERARRDLEEMLRLQPDPTASPGPSALLRLGRCHARLGAEPAARHTWTYLLEHQPMMIEPYLELGRLERRADRPAAARSYLIEGLRLVRSDPSQADRYLDEFLEELTDLPATDQQPT